jgi:hypothetical protein
MNDRDQGSATLTTVVLTPVFIVVAFAAFQAALWTHARTESRAVARDAAVLVARAGEPAEAVASSAQRLLNDEVRLTRSDVEIDDTTDLVRVTVRGSAPGMFRWTASEFEVVEALPREGFRP